MRCPEFISRYSEYHDGRLNAERSAAFEAHARACSRCGRYQAVLERSTGLLRQLPQLKTEPRFRESLVQRIYVDGELERLWMGSRGSAVTTGAVLALAVVLTALAWSPAFRDNAPSEVREAVELPDQGVRATPVGTFSSSIIVDPPAPDAGLWQSPNDLLHAYSSLSNRTRNTSGGLVRTGLTPEQ